MLDGSYGCDVVSSPRSSQAFDREVTNFLTQGSATSESPNLLGDAFDRCVVTQVNSPHLGFADIGHFGDFNDATFSIENVHSTTSIAECYPA